MIVAIDVPTPTKVGVDIVVQISGARGRYAEPIPGTTNVHSLASDRTMLRKVGLLEEGDVVHLLEILRRIDDTNG